MKTKKEILIILVVLIVSAFSVYAQQELYVISRGEHKIYAYKLANENAPRMLVNTPDLAGSFDIAFHPNSRKLLWVRATRGQGFLQRSEVQGSNVTDTESDNVRVPIDLELDHVNEKIYWVDYELRKIFRSDFEGMNEEVIVEDGLEYPTSIALSPGDNLMFWADLELKKIFSGSLDGENVTTILTDDIDFPVRLAVDTRQKKLYWTDDVALTISRANFDGSRQEVIYRGGGEEHPFGLFLDTRGNKLYWTDYGTDEVLRSNLDGSQVEVVASDIKDPVGLTIINNGLGENLALIPGQDIQSTGYGEYLDILPNPASSRLAFSFFIAREGLRTISVYNQFGQLAKQWTTRENRLEVNLKDLAAGLYICKVEMDDLILQKQFVLVK